MRRKKERKEGKNDGRNVFGVAMPRHLSWSSLETKIVFPFNVDIRKKMLQTHLTI